MRLVMRTPPHHAAAVMRQLRHERGTDIVCRDFVGNHHRPQDTEFFHECRFAAQVGYIVRSRGRKERAFHPVQRICIAMNREQRIRMRGQDIHELSLIVRTPYAIR